MAHAIVATLLVVGTCRAADAPAAQAPDRLDALSIDAVQSYLEPKRNTIAVGTGISPFDPYYTGFSLNAGYTRYFANELAWEVLNGSYSFGVQKDLTSQLAAFGVTPARIEKLEYVVSSSLVLIPSYGKSVIFNRFIQQVRTALLLGPGLVKTSQTSSMAVIAGARLETLFSEVFALHIEARDYYMPSKSKNFFALNLGTGINF